MLNCSLSLMHNVFMLWKLPIKRHDWFLCCTGSSMAKCHKINQCLNKFWWMCLDQMLLTWEQAESHNQFQNSSQLIQILVYFMTLCHGWPCKEKKTKKDEQSKEQHVFTLCCISKDLIIEFQGMCIFLRVKFALVISMRAIWLKVFFCSTLFGLVIDGNTDRDKLLAY